MVRLSGTRRFQARRSHSFYGLTCLRREHARRPCVGVTSKRLAHEVTLVVSELVTNAVKYDKGEIRVVLRVSRGEVFVAVQDRGAPFVLPLLVADPFRVGGRGLPIVAELASDWGIDHLGGASNVLWCVVHARAPDDGRGSCDSACGWSRIHLSVGGVRDLQRPQAFARRGMGVGLVAQQPEAAAAVGVQQWRQLRVVTSLTRGENHCGQVC